MIIIKEKREKRKKLIIKFLKQHGRSATGRIHGFYGWDPTQTKKILEEMLESKMLKCEKETTATYWLI
jgi:hypothetical protein